MRAFVLVVVAVSLVACKSGPRTVPARDRMVIRADEIATIQAANAHDIVSKLRGSFLRSRGPITASRDVPQNPSIMVFIDGVEAGPVESALQQIPASEVREIRLYSASDAVTRYGTRFNGGVIDVLTPRSARQ
jgi:hypothetical protein